MKICMIMLTLMSGRPGHFNAQRINQITIEKRPTGITTSEEVTAVNKYYVKEKPEEVIRKIKMCELM